MPSFKAPKGTRDFYPEDMAIRRRIEDAWRSASIRHGFEEIEGPTFEHLGLYTVKSGEGIVSELFSFRRSGGTDDYALRPEFTPTLARMVAARGNSLPRPVKWFAIPSQFRAERPQRGRLREFFQWNVDMLGLDDPSADAEVVATGLSALDALGLRPDVATVRLSHRDAVASALGSLGVAGDSMHAAFQLLDRRDKLPPEDFVKKAGELGLDVDGLAAFDRLARIRRPLHVDPAEIAAETGVPAPAGREDAHPLCTQAALHRLARPEPRRDKDALFAADDAPEAGEACWRWPAGPTGPAGVAQGERCASEDSVILDGIKCPIKPLRDVINKGP